MGMYQWIRGVFDAPSRRNDADYSKDVGEQAIVGVLMIYREFIGGNSGAFGGRNISYCGLDKWLPNVIEEMAHLHHPLIAALDKHHVFPLQVIQTYLTMDSTPNSAFLDFMELSFRNRWAPCDDDFLAAVNHVLDMNRSPYLMTPYSRHVVQRDDGGESNEITAYPRVYLKQDSIIQKEAIEPVLEIFSDPAFEIPFEDFRTALSRHRTGDYDGCITACAAAVEGTIKVVAGKLKWRMVKGNALETLAQSFISKSSLPDTLCTLFRPLAHWRNTKADAHGHATKDETTEEIARHFIANAASLIVLVQSQVK